MFPKSKLSAVNANNNSAAYSYLANSPLVSQITFSQSGATRMTTSKQYDYLNRLTQISSAPSASYTLPLAFNYNYNPANQRTKDTLADGSYWVYSYDTLGQVTGGNKYFRDGTPVPGQQFGYSFDTIGNRTQIKVGGDQTGANQRVVNYTNNVLNQLTSRGVTGTNDVIGAALATNSVTVNGLPAFHKGEYFWQPVGTNNGSSPAWEQVTAASGGNTTTGGLYVPENPEQFSYDPDGNLTNDGRWSYTWDAENRLIGMALNTGVGPQYQLSFAYDAQGRRIQKSVVSNSVALYTDNFLYDGWNLVAILNPPSTVVESFLWGNDLSGSPQGAGGVGGLLEVSYNGSTTTNCFPAFDGNGNLAALVNAANGTLVANYEYGPFGEVIRSTGPMAKVNPMRFSTKYQDDESDILYYGYRYYKPSTGIWINKDPMGEQGGINLNGFVGNDGVNNIDVLGLDWIIERNGGFLASATPGTPLDSFSDLANKLHLNLSDYQKWAHTKDQSPSLCKTYLIPNSILIDFGYADFLDTYLDIAFIGTWQDVYKGVAARLQNQGYYVLISNPASSSQIKAHLTLDGLYSYVFVGHGAGFGAINGFDPYQSPPVEPGRYTKYGIFALNLYGCDTAQTVGGTHHLPNGWEKNVATVGFFTGFTDEVDGFNPTQSMVSIPGTNQQ